MGIKSFFNRLGEKRVAKAKSRRLADAIAVCDLEGVRAALADGADPRPPVDYAQRPLSLAVKAGNLPIVEELIKTPAGAKALAEDFCDTVSVGDLGEPATFARSFLYGAIRLGSDDIALMLAWHPAVNVEYPGTLLPECFAYDEAIWAKLRPPAEIARRYGMPEVADAITERMEPVLAARERKRTEGQQAEADKVLKLVTPPSESGFSL
ncbi:MAG: hypothetical protein ACAH83_10355 [Alphaproteobacteria bacterium]